jgi:hypothetical protein
MKGIAEVVMLFNAVKGLQASRIGIAEHLGPDGLGLSDDHCIGMLHSLFRKHGGVYASYDYLDAQFAIGIRYLVSAACGCGHGGDAHQVGAFLEVDLLQVLVYDAGLYLLGCISGQAHKAQGRQQGPVPNSLALLLGINQVQSQVLVLSLIGAVSFNGIGSLSAIPDTY